MAKKKNRYRNCHEERRVELLKDYYDFSEETKTFDIVLHFEKASDLFNERLNLLKKKVMKDEIVEEAARLLEDVPRGYKADLSLVIDDYENIPYGEILDSFHNVLRVRLSRYKADNRRKYFKVGALILIGTFLVALMILGEVMNWWGGEKIEGRLISYLIDTAGCVLIWEGLYAAMLDRSPEASLGYALSTKLSSIGLYRNDESDKALLSENNGDAVFIERDRPSKKIGSICLYLSGFFLVGSGVIGILLTAPTFASVLASNTSLGIVLAVIRFISSSLLCGLGVLAVKMYNENYRYFVLTAVVATVIAALVILTFVSMFVTQTSPSHIIASTASLVAMILYSVGFALSTFHNFGDIKRTLRRK